MLLPLVLAALPSTVSVTVSMAPAATVIVGTTGASPYALALAAADASTSFHLLRPQSTFSLDLAGHYGQPLVVSGVTNPPRDVSGRARGRYDVITSPRTNMVFLAEGFVSSRIGLRAADELAVRDPFSTNRVLDGWSLQNSLSGRMSPRAALRVDLRYAQMGAIWADVPAAVGVDSHAVLATATASFQVTRRLASGPVARIGWTHFNHALLDVNFTRGPAEVTALSVLGFARYELTPRTRASVVAGVTLASAPPGAKDLRTITSPDVRVEMRTLGRRLGGTAAISFGYQSVGPRIGFGMDYAGMIDAWVRPFSGGDRRDFLVHLVARARRANTSLPIIAATNRDHGSVMTTALAYGTSILTPIRLGWMVYAGVDLEFVSMHVDPLPERGDPPTAFRTLFTLGLTASAATDRSRLVPRDPLAPLEDGRMAAPVRAPRRNATTGVLERPADLDVENDD